MMTTFLVLWFAAAILSAAWVAYDVTTGQPEIMRVMKIAWVLITLYLGVVGLVLYITSCREPAASEHEQFVAPMWKQALGSSVHCVAGDAVRIVVVAAITAMTPLSMFVDFVGIRRRLPLRLADLPGCPDDGYAGTDVPPGAQGCVRGRVSVANHHGHRDVPDHVLADGDGNGNGRRRGAHGRTDDAALLGCHGGWHRRWLPVHLPRQLVDGGVWLEAWHGQRQGDGPGGAWDANRRRASVRRNEPSPL